VQLRQSYLRIAKRAAMMAGRYAHAKQFQPSSPATAPAAHPACRISVTFAATSAARLILSRVRVATHAANQIRSQQQRQRGWKLYSFHAPEVECIGKGKASAPYEFGVKASIVTTNAAPRAVSSCCTPWRCR